jgi:hypothetical protein
MSPGIDGVLERLACGELDGFRRWNRDGLASRRIATGTFGASTRQKRAESDQLDCFAARDRRRHGLENGINGFARAGLAFARWSVCWRARQLAAQCFARTPVDRKEGPRDTAALSSTTRDGMQSC